MFKRGFFGGKFLPFHKGHLHCILKAAAQCEKLYVVIMHHGEEELETLENCKFDPKYLTPEVRQRVMNQEFYNFPNIHIVSYDCRPAHNKAVKDGKHLWHYECQDMVDMLGEFDAAFSSEPEYSELFKHFYPWTTPVLLDVDRDEVNVKGRELRCMTIDKAYDFLPRSYQQYLNKSVLITGTESCGKTTLTNMLSKYYNTSKTEEFGREISDQFGMSSPGIEFYNSFLYGQKAREWDAKLKANRVYICDTDHVVTNFYANLYEDTNLDVADAMMKVEDYDLIIYLKPTNKWVDDGLRVHGEESQRLENDRNLFKMYEGKEIHVLAGDYLSNYLESIKLIDELLERG